jgi:exosortase
VRTGLIAALVCSLAWLYAGLGRGLLVQWAVSPDASYGAILAFFALLIFWQRRDRIFSGSRTSRRSSFGLLVAACGVALYLAGLFAADLFTTRASFVFVTAGLLWFLHGSTALTVALTPLAFLLLAIPLPELVVTALTSSLQGVASRTAEAALTTAGIAVYRDGNVLELPGATIQVVEACSGLRSVVSLASLGVLLVWATGGPPMGRAILLLSTIPIAVVTNGLRVAATGAATEVWGVTVMKDPWHSLMGWLTFVVSIGALWAVRWIVLQYRPPEASPRVVET